MVDWFQSAQIALLHSRMSPRCISGIKELNCNCGWGVLSPMQQYMTIVAKHCWPARPETGNLRNFWPLAQIWWADSLTRHWWDNHDLVMLLFKISHLSGTSDIFVGKYMKYLACTGFEIVGQDRSMKVHEIVWNHIMVHNVYEIFDQHASSGGFRTGDRYERGSAVQ